ncbi:MAG: hypothetical protein AAGH46_10950, partial [Bacteroidota bacterium]
YDLGEPNNSTVTYAFDLYEISGERDGCTVTLESRIAGKLVKTEIRRIPDCEDEKEEEEDKDDGFSEDDPGVGMGDESSDDPPGEPWDVGYYLIGLRVNSSSVFVSNPGLFRVGVTRSYSSVSGAILQDENEEYYYTYKAFHYGFEARYYQTNSGATKLTQQINFPQENRRGADYAGDYVWRFDGISIPRAAALSGRFIYGENWRVKEYIRSHNLPSRSGFLSSLSFDGFTSRKNDATIIKVLGSVVIKKGLPTRRGNSGKSRRQDEQCGENMDKKCCQMIAQIYDVLGIDEIIDEGFNIPTEMYAPEGKAVKRLDNYPQILDYQMRQVNHTGIGGFDIEVANSGDSKNKSGEIGFKAVNGTDAIRQIAQMLIDIENGKGLFAKAFLSIFITLGEFAPAINIAADTVEQISSFLGMRGGTKRRWITLPFNVLKLQKITSSKGVGFDKKKKDKKSKQNQVKTDEILLAEILEQSQQSYDFSYYNDNYPDLVEIVSKNLTISNDND